MRKKITPFHTDLVVGLNLQSAYFLKTKNYPSFEYKTVRISD